MKPLIHNRDLLVLLPVLLVGYAVLYLLAVAYGHGPVPPVQNLIDNLALIFWVWVAAFVLNTIHWNVWVYRGRR